MCGMLSRRFASCTIRACKHESNGLKGGWLKQRLKPLHHGKDINPISVAPPIHEAMGSHPEGPMGHLGGRILLPEADGRGAYGKAPKKKSKGSVESRPFASRGSWRTQASQWKKTPTWSLRATSTAWWQRRQADSPNLCRRRIWLTCGTTYGSSSWLHRTGSRFSPLETLWDQQDQLRYSRDDPPPLQPEFLKWRHWRPGKVREMEPTTQRALELHLRGKWAERLLAHLAPFAEHISYMQDILGDFRKEALDLLGDSRFRHCGNTAFYESLRKRGFTVIPWQERHVRSLLNQRAEEEVTPYKLRQVKNTLKWYSKTFGVLKIDELHRLKSKKSALEEALADTVARPQRKAVVPSKGVIWARRKGRATSARHELLDSLMLGFARFNNLQHVHPKDLAHTSNTVELKAWQTKTVSAAMRRELIAIRSH